MGSVGYLGSLHNPSVTVVTDSRQPMGEGVVEVENLLERFLVGDWMNVEHASSGDWVHA